MSKLSRRNFLELSFGAAIVLPAVNSFKTNAETINLQTQSIEPLAIDVSAPLPKVLKNHLKMGASRSPDGQIVTADSRSLLLNDKPWSPVMGEFHYARCPETEWRDELLKIKAGGIDIVASYVFWIHHEEVEGTFDWSGRRDLRRFVELCKEVGLYTFVRCGPWCHGEVRNGGLPDWILKKGFNVRGDNPGYLEKARRLYEEIANQLKGLFWKDGGTIIGIQFENEYRGAAEHLLTLKRIGREVGLDAPLYTRTGWPQLKTKIPLGEMLPLFGSYADGFWDRAITKMPGRYGDAFLFKLARNDAEVATDQLGRRIENDGDDVANYPYLCCEIGGGMERSYHRRIRIYPEDILAASMVKLGAGNNLQGFYMYHGGVNPEGRLTTLQESQATNYWNDVPVKSYDFQAPLGEFGQIRKHYHQLRLTHIFLRDFGSSLATMPAYLPAKQPGNANDTNTLRWSARSDGESGFIFISNYHRLEKMPPKENVQFELKLKDGKLKVPSAPFTVPANCVSFMPFNLDLNGAKLVYATAQPVCRLDDKDTTYFFFSQIKDIPSEFVFDKKGIRVEQTLSRATEKNGHVYFSQIKAGTNTALHLRTDVGKRTAIILLDEKQSLDFWKAEFAGRERVFLTHSGLLADNDKLRLRAINQVDLSVAIFPASKALIINGAKAKTTNDGIFQLYKTPKPKPSNLKVEFEKIKDAVLPAREVRKGSKDVAEAPSDEDFDKAAVWRIKFSEKTDGNILLNIRYVGDVARLYLDGKFITDNFYNGNAFEFGLKRYSPDVYQKELHLKILPLRKDAPIYLQDEAKPDFGNNKSIVRLDGIDIVENFEATFEAT